ncbi:cupin domain-containing protein [Roseivirga misakiensis]|uniref:cupin domain-containing protein n=1 Tax=Roseivirga misakiensis TaxID=1563681 RepID=UPI000B4950DE|nr:cupin domain-containing protein [Roseivirga misakiensis]
MRPLVEKISPDVGSSFHIQKYVTKHECALDYWHHHPEYELVYVHQGKAELCIGNYLSNFQDGVLLFIGPNIPHQPFLKSGEDHNFEIVLQLKEDFMGEGFFEKPELAQIKQLFERAKQGIIFGKETKERSEEMLLNILTADPFKRLVLLLDFLHELTTSSDYKIINSNAASLAI